ncbi:MAG TPA: alcohol dehydrogenase catalytic domain-containing protein [Candidatus Binataceae bacterium]
MNDPVTAHQADSQARPELCLHSRQMVLLEPGKMEMRDYTPPHPGPGEILLQVKCALTCGTDLKFFRRGHPLFEMPKPFGHEFSGIVAETGQGVSQFKTGDAVMAAPTAPCGECFYCKRDQENLCPDLMSAMVWGAYADYLLLPARVVTRNAFPKPVDLSFAQAALLEPLSCVLHAQEAARPERFETVLVVGAGAFGLLHLLALKYAGVRNVVVAGRHENRLKAAAELGADGVIDVVRDDAAARVSRLNDGFGPDLVIEATGQLKGWHDAVDYVRRGGRVVFFGGCPANTALTVKTRRMHYDNLTLLGPFHFRPRDVRRAVDLLAAGSLGAGRIINGHRSLEDLKEVFSQLERGVFLKCAIVP